MATRDVYVLSEATKSTVNGAQTITLAGTFETTTGDDAGSVFRLGKMGADWIPIRIDINCDAITGATDMNLGIHRTKENGGAVKDYDVLMDGANLSGGKALGSEQSGLSHLPVDKIGSPIYALAGDSDASDQMYDLTLTTDANITAAATISIRALFAKFA